MIAVFAIPSDTPIIIPGGGTNRTEPNFIFDLVIEKGISCGWALAWLLCYLNAAKHPPEVVFVVSQDGSLMADLIS